MNSSSLLIIMVVVCAATVEAGLIHRRQVKLEPNQYLPAEKEHQRPGPSNMEADLIQHRQYKLEKNQYFPIKLEHHQQPVESSYMDGEIILPEPIVPHEEGLDA